MDFALPVVSGLRSFTVVEEQGLFLGLGEVFCTVGPGTLHTPGGKFAINCRVPVPLAAVALQHLVARGEICQ